MVNQDLYIKLLQAEVLVRVLVMKGFDNNEQLIEAIDNQFHPKTEQEQEMFSEAILYAKYGVLN